MSSNFHELDSQWVEKLYMLFEPPHWKTNNLPRRKQSRRSASR